MNALEAAVYRCGLPHPGELAAARGLPDDALPCRRRAAADDWFPEGIAARRDQGYAARLCAGCPVLAECREWALATRQAYGVWGGMSEAARERLLRRRGAAPAASGHGRPVAAGGAR